MSGSTISLAYAVWPTAFGAMGAVLGAEELKRVVLPHYDPKDLRELLAFEHPGAAVSTEGLAELIRRTGAYFNGHSVSFDDIPCALPPATSFTGAVLRACRTIPYGQTRGYSWLAGAAGKPQGARAAAAVMGRNVLPLVIPCHRVIHAGGNLGGFSAPGGAELKHRMLALERAL